VVIMLFGGNMDGSSNLTCRAYGMENQPDFRIKAADEDHLHFNELRAAAAQYAG
jgi:hypothetical protein